MSETLPLVWVSFAALIMLGLAVFGWLVAWYAAVESCDDRKRLRTYLRRYDAQRSRLAELRMTVGSLIRELRDANPKEPRS